MFSGVGNSVLQLQGHGELVGLKLGKPPLQAWDKTPANSWLSLVPGDEFRRDLKCFHQCLHHLLLQRLELI
jgi:hypothetical protein